MSSCFGCGGLQPEVKLLNDCYPPSKALLAAGPDFKPLSSDLSKLTYRCTNQSSKLAKVGEELEKRVAKESARSTGGYPKSRASLLISLAILRALISECRRDLTLFTRSIIRIINHAIDVKVYQKGEPDLEVIGRAASCFTAFTTYADGGAVGVEDNITATYLQVLRKFSALAYTKSSSEKPDQESVNRARLIGLAALHGASSSDALFSTNSETGRQIDIVVPALLANIFEGSLDHLKVETAKIEVDASPSPYFSEFSARRPINDRRAPSLHVHIAGEKGPEEIDVLSAALRSLHALVRQCQVNQATHVLNAVSLFLDKIGWTDVERCCWLAERLTNFISLQYRFVVPTRLIETLVDLRDTPPTHKHTTIVAMVTTILNSPTSLVGLGVTDLLNNLVSMIVRRLKITLTDGLLPPLVQCIASLGTHIYYADQINDVIYELALRISEVPAEDKVRDETMRVLIYAMIGVMNTAVAGDITEARATAHQESFNNVDKGKKPAMDSPVEQKSYSRRNAVTTEVWQETLALLCESTFAVRSAYARALTVFLMNEIKREGKVYRYSPSAQRFCHSLHAAVYTLAMSSCLGNELPLPSIASPRGSPVVASAEVPRTESPEGIPKTETKASNGEKGVSFNLTEPTPAATPGDTTNGASTPVTATRSRRGSRRVSLPLNAIHTSNTATNFDNVATPYDFANVIKILQELYKAVPGTALRTGVPMLLALDRDAVSELVRVKGDGRQDAWVLERKRAIKEVLAVIWRFLGEKWEIRGITELTTRVINSLPEPFEVPNPAAPPPGILPMPEDPVQFVKNEVEGESSNSIQPLLDPELLVASLVGSSAILSATGSTAGDLTKAFAAKWSVEDALRNSVERYSSAQPKAAPDTHFDVANVLMSMNNPSYQSFNRPQSKAVDVTDLREALGGKVDSVPTSAPPSIISTTGGRSVREDPAFAGSPKRRAVGSPPGNSDVQEVLKDIFKGKKKHHAAAKAKQPESLVNGHEKAQNGIVAPNGHAAATQGPMVELGKVMG